MCFYEILFFKNAFYSVLCFVSRIPYLKLVYMVEKLFFVTMVDFLPKMKKMSKKL